MRKLNTSTARILLALWLLPVAAAAQDLPMPTDWDTVYAWFLVANPEHVRGDDAHEAAVTHDHIQYQLRLQQDGLAVAGGGLGRRRPSGDHRPDPAARRLAGRRARPGRGRSRGQGRPVHQPGPGVVDPGGRLP